MNHRVVRASSTEQDEGYVMDDSHEAAEESGGSPSKARKAAVLRQMMEDINSQNFDVIRFASYRTACKLRFIQKKTECECCFTLDAAIAGWQPQRNVAVIRIAFLARVCIDAALYCCRDQMPALGMNSVEM
ncbi:PREDICTED: uncharacterized protein LOC106815772 [Priapulus caudatus]|uniref:Uncharacterized protein LOC106815772 n=1 Tax=Priapulus caudatus TaxID=37621 RepID=A0ABM1EU94_PRICU|nr:PREDICTED: uncharacterized protein LOC106815772 [Priapulus caudatus]